MKRVFQIALVLAFCIFGYRVVAQMGKQSKSSPQSERREIREKRRADRQAAYEKYVDSLIISHNYQFNPQTMQREVAGPMRMISNPNFCIDIWNTGADIFIPYIKGYVPPYHYTIINYTLPTLDGYVAEQTDEGWIVTFKSTLFTGTDFTFVLDISSKFGGANLTIKNPLYTTVQYTGTISQLY